MRSAKPRAGVAVEKFVEEMALPIVRGIEPHPRGAGKGALPGLARQPQLNQPIGELVRHAIEPASQAQLLNLSTRMDVKTGDNVLIGGFIVTGNVAKKVILRAIGPSLASALAGVLADPVLELHAANGDLITSNDNWKDTQQTEIEATGIHRRTTSNPPSSPRSIPMLTP